MIMKPSVGRVVWFRPNNDDRTRMTVHSNQPLKADVVYVWGDRMVNLLVVDHAGITHVRTSVDLIQEGDTIPESISYCEWMPYQIAVAKGEIPLSRHAAAARDSTTGA